jgi:DNA-binding transcriptional LysR family regulator
VARDPLAIGALVREGLAVTLTPRLLAGELAGIATVPVEAAPQRVVAVVLPASGVSPLARELLAALEARVA